MKMIGYLSSLNKKAKALLFCLCFTHYSYGQTEPIYSQYMLNMLPLNPAYAGSQENLSMTAVYRKQWTGIEGAPNTQTFSAHSPLHKKNIALGFSFLHDKIGVTDRTGVYGVYAYRIKFKNKSILSLGLQAGLNRMAFALNDLQTRLPNDPVGDETKITYLEPGFGGGLYWYSDFFFLGASMPDLFVIRSKKESSEALHYKHLFLHGGFVYKLSSQVKHLPSVLIKEQGMRVQYDINNVFIFNEVLWLGVSYRISASVNFLVQAQLTNQLAFGYSYDVPVNGLRNIAGATHELKVNYKFVFFKENAFMPRYF